MGQQNVQAEEVYLTAKGFSLAVKKYLLSVEPESNNIISHMESITQKRDVLTGSRMCALAVRGGNKACEWA